MKTYFALILSMAALPCLALRAAPGTNSPIPGAPQSSVTQMAMSANPLDDRLLTKPFANADHGQLVEKQAPGLRRAGEATVKATLKFPMLEDEWIMPWKTVRIYNSQGFYEEIDIESYDADGNFVPTDSWEFSVPAGRYDFLSIFAQNNPNQMFGFDHDVYYIVENAEVAEGSVIELKPEESTVRVGMETTNPDGEKTRFRKIRYLDTDWNWEIIEEGNVADVYLSKLVFFKGECIYNLFMSNAGGVVVEPGPCGEFDAQANCDFFVNPVSDNYVFRSIRRMPAWPDQSKGLYVAVTEARGGVAGVYMNAPDYKSENSIVEHTPAVEQYPIVDANDGPYMLSMAGYWNGRASSSGTRTHSVSDEIWKVSYAGPEKPIDPDAIYLVYSKALEDADIPEHDEWGDYVTRTEIESPKIFPYAPGGVAARGSVGSDLGNFPGGEHDYDSFPGNTTFLSFLSDNEIQAGGSAPMITSWITPYYDWDTQKIVVRPAFYYSGRISEQLGSTSALAAVRLSLDGETVAETKADAHTWMIANHDKTGKYEMTIDTDNFEIDGLKGGNKAVAVWNHGDGKFTSPTATMLQFRDSKGDVTQRFAKPDDVEMLLSAADFEPFEGELDEKYGWLRYWFEPKAPVSVKAWCTPYGSDAEAMCEIPLQEKPDGFYAPGFGALYTASLSSVNMQSPTGWFDLTIVVEGANGNTQTQTISPAFQISSLSGIPNLRDVRDVRVEGNRIIAPEGSRIFNVSGVEARGNDLAKGVYIVVTTAGEACKVAVR